MGDNNWDQDVQGREIRHRDSKDIKLHAVKIINLFEFANSRPRDCGPGKLRDKCSGETHMA